MGMVILLLVLAPPLVLAIPTLFKEPPNDAPGERDTETTWSWIVLSMAVVSFLLAGGDSDGPVALGCLGGVFTAWLSGFAVIALSSKRRGGSYWRAVVAAGASTVATITAIAGGEMQFGGPKGRLLRIAGRTRTAPVRRSDDWLTGIDAAPIEDASERALAASLWTTAAQVEHASVPAFSILSTRLIAIGAPPELVRRCHLAAMDEIEHTRLAFALASSYAGHPIGPGPLPELVDRAQAARSVDETFVRLAYTSVVDGCLGEGVAAEVARRGAENTVFEGTRRVFGRIAADEAVHAELAWDIAEWCLEAGPVGVRDALVEARAALHKPAPPVVVPEAPVKRLRAHGVLTVEETTEVRDAVVRELDTKLARLLTVPFVRAA